MTFNDDQGNVRYRVGIDVGTNSTGFCAVEVDESGYPLRILNSLVYLHDSGVDPKETNGKAASRKATRGVARRQRRLHREKVRRLEKLDSYLQELGWPLVDVDSEKSVHLAWHVRAELLRHYVEDDEARQRMLSIAVRHIARHRGARSAYSRVESLFTLRPSSKFLVALRKDAQEKFPFIEVEDAHPAQILDQILKFDPRWKLRGKDGLFTKPLLQSDNAAEIFSIAEMQKLDRDLTENLIRKIFDARGSRGSALKNVARDPLPGQEGYIRAEKTHPEFQKFRIVSVLANLRIGEGGEARSLTAEEMQGLTEYLLEASGEEEPSWQDVANYLNVDRRHLHGVARKGVDAEPALRCPPIDETTKKIRESTGLSKFVKWWNSVDAEMRGAFIDGIYSNVGTSERALAQSVVKEYFADWPDETIDKIRKLPLPGGRSAYSVDSLKRLTRVMLEQGCDLHKARQIEFGVDDFWSPPAECINAQTGNPTVDRVTKQVARYLFACERKWGAPESVNVEHVRSAWGVESEERKKENRKREKINRENLKKMHESLGIGRSRIYDQIRYQALVRQGCRCLYCGDQIDYFTMQMDHIVPRDGQGATNRRENLAATCVTCNKLKGRQLFSDWVNSSSGDWVSSRVSFEEVRLRVRDFEFPESMSEKEKKKFKKEVLERLMSTKPDEEFDGRSLESVAWMAKELRHRIEAYYAERQNSTEVHVYRGELTAMARRVTGFEKQVKLIGPQGKNRFDRRHHAMDALVIALMQERVSQTIALRNNMMAAEKILGREGGRWRNFTGCDEKEKCAWDRWNKGMLRALELFNVALSQNSIPLMYNTRLRLGNSKVHKAEIMPLVKVAIKNALSVELIDCASTPALWCALTRHPDFDEKNGLPADASRQICVNGRRISGEEKIDFFPTKAASLAVRDGYCLLGSAHHSRIYRMWNAKGKEFYGQVRVYQVDLVKHQKEDLFSVELPPQSISVRTAEPKVREALVAGRCEYIGWLVVGDEIEIDISSFSSGAISELAEAYPMCTRWKVAGFKEPDVVRLRPLLLSAEGMPEESPKGIQEIVSGPGWRPAVNKLFSNHSVRIIRRTALGEERWHKHGSLPSSFEVDGR